MSESVLPCFVCGRPLASVWRLGSDAEQQADGACYFTTYGQYGSTSFDPMDGSYLEINICDNCLTSRRDRVLVCTDQVKRTRRSQPWIAFDQDIE